MSNKLVPAFASAIALAAVTLGSVPASAGAYDYLSYIPRPGETCREVGQRVFNEKMAGYNSASPHGRAIIASIAMDQRNKATVGCIKMTRR